MSELLRIRSVSGLDEIKDKEGKNPFIQPSDEMIFSYKDDEKMQKSHRLELNKSLKIIDKSKHIRAGRIKHLTAIGDIESKLAIPKIKDAASLILSQRRPAASESRRVIIDKKREMFFMQLMIENKQSEIQKLDEYSTLRKDGLDYSQKLMELQEDRLLKYKEKKKDECLKLANEAEALSRDKVQLILSIKELSELESKIMNEISINSEKLEVYLKAKSFLEKVSKKMLFTRPNKDSNKEGGKIPSHILECINDPCEKYKIPFKNMTEFYEEFINLEQQNIFLVQHNHELEEQLERLEQRNGIKKEVILDNLNKNKTNLNLLNNQLKEEKDGIAKNNFILSSKINSEEISEAFNFLKEKINSVYQEVKREGENKYEPLEQLTAIELMMRDRLYKIKEFEEAKGGFYRKSVSDVEINHEKMRRNLKKQEEVKEYVALTNKKMQERMRKKEERFKMKPFGRKMMTRSVPKITKTIKEEKPIINVEEEEYKRYFEET